MFVAVLLSACLLASVNGQRIAGGDPTDIQEYPFAVALLTNGGAGTSYDFGCGGTIITTRAVLSAASCFYTSTNVHLASWWRARVGSTYSTAGGTVYMVNRITTNPGFSTVTLANNLAVLRTTLQIVLVPGVVQTARVSGPAYTFAINQAVTAIGWGATSNQSPALSRELREVEVYSIDQTTCTNRWTELGFTVTASNVCTGWLDVGIVGQCAGDAGSPLLDKEGGFVVGVFSRTQGCANPWYPDINTRVQPYLSWIIEAAYQE